MKSYAEVHPGPGEFNRSLEYGVQLATTRIRIPPAGTNDESAPIAGAEAAARASTAARC